MLLNPIEYDFYPNGEVYKKTYTDNDMEESLIHGVTGEYIITHDDRLSRITVNYDPARYVNDRVFDSFSISPSTDNKAVLLKDTGILKRMDEGEAFTGYFTSRGLYELQAKVTLEGETRTARTTIRAGSET